MTRMRVEWMSGLWFALALPAIAALYLLKRTYIDTPVSSHLLWNRVLKEMEANRPWQKLRNRLLLYIQLLAAALLVLAIMQPFIWQKQGASEQVVVIVDTSASMLAKVHSASGRAGGDSPTAPTRLDEAKRQLLEWADKEAKGSRITLIAAGREPELLLSREASREALNEAVEKLAPTYGITAYHEALSLASSLTRDDPRMEVRLLTDGQWAEASAGAVSFNVPVSVMQIGGEAGGNVSVIRFGVSPDGGKSGAVSAVATVKNWSDRPEAFDISLYAGDRLASVKRESFQAGEQRSLFWQGLPESGDYRVRLETNDAFAEDNEAYALLMGAREKNAIILSKGNLFLEKALGLAGVSVIKPQLNGNTFVPTELEADLIVLDNVQSGSMDAAWEKRLAGKPVWYIGNLPGVGGTESKPAREMTVTSHPVMKFIKLQDAHIARLWKPQEVTWGEPVARLGDTPVVYAGEDNGKKRLLFAFDLHESDLPLRSEFPVLVQNAVEWLTESSSTGLGSAIAGDKLEAALSAKTVSAIWQPVYPSDSAKATGELQADRQGTIVSSVQTVPSVPGVYRFVERDSEGATVQARLLTVAMDAREMNVALRPQLDTIIGRTGTTNAVTGITGQEGRNGQAAKEDVAQAGNSQTDGRMPYHLLRWIIVLAIAAVLLEWGVYRRGHTI
ncbi:vWA domain-containing protein [Paenibacillus sp. MBLB4367]|uniref:vWA domain-containing protein n=1 Tax=Paenibacillus sp. MBLB4367 TaxID=3384767 RepID=UPI00390844FA